MPMAIRRAIRCGVRAGRFFNGRWRDKFLSSRAQKDATSRLNRDAAFFLLQKMQWTVVSSRYSVREEQVRQCSRLLPRRGKDWCRGFARGRRDGGYSRMTET